MNQLENTKRTTERILTIEEMNKEYNVSIKFRENQLSELQRDQKLSLYIKLDITFIENEQDFFNINLNEKFVSVPYAYVVFDNKQYMPSPVILLIAVITVLTFVVTLYICF